MFHVPTLLLNASCAPPRSITRGRTEPENGGTTTISLPPAVGDGPLSTVGVLGADFVLPQSAWEESAAIGGGAPASLGALTSSSTNSVDTDAHLGVSLPPAVCYQSVFELHGVEAKVRSGATHPIGGGRGEGSLAHHGFESPIGLLYRSPPATGVHPVFSALPAQVASFYASPVLRIQLEVVRTVRLPNAASKNGGGATTTESVASARQDWLIDLRRFKHTEEPLLSGYHPAPFSVFLPSSTSTAPPAPFVTCLLKCTDGVVEHRLPVLLLPASPSPSLPPRPTHETFQCLLSVPSESISAVADGAETTRKNGQPAAQHAAAAAVDPAASTSPRSPRNGRQSPAAAMEGGCIDHDAQALAMDMLVPPPPVAGSSPSARSSASAGGEEPRRLHRPSDASRLLPVVAMGLLPHDGVTGSALSSTTIGPDGGSASGLHDARGAGGGGDEWELVNVRGTDVVVQRAADLPLKALEDQLATSLALASALSILRAEGAALHHEIAERLASQARASRKQALCAQLRAEKRQLEAESAASRKSLEDKQRTFTTQREVLRQQQQRVDNDIDLVERHENSRPHRESLRTEKTDACRKLTVQLNATRSRLTQHLGGLFSLTPASICGLVLPQDPGCVGAAGAAAPAPLSTTEDQAYALAHAAHLVAIVADLYRVTLLHPAQIAPARVVIEEYPNAPVEKQFALAATKTSEIATMARGVALLRSNILCCAMAAHCQQQADGLPLGIALLKLLLKQ